jgi:hypothetical protein
MKTGGRRERVESMATRWLRVFPVISSIGFDKSKWSWPRHRGSPALRRDGHTPEANELLAPVALYM